jgi:amino acid transporter
MMQTTNQLKKNSLGLWSIIFFVVAAASPLTGVVGAVPVAFFAGNGAGVPGVFLLAGLILLVFSFGYVAMSRHIVNAGAFYSYISIGLGRKCGVAGLKVALLAYAAIQLSVVSMFGFFSQMFVQEHFQLNLPWWAYSLVMLVTVLLLGVQKVELGGRLLGVLMLMEICIVLLTDIGLLAHLRPAMLEFSSFAPSVATHGAMGVALIFAIGSFVGFEATAIYSEECRNPEKVIPRATLLAVVLITVFFAFTTWVFVQACGPAEVAALASKDPGHFVFQLARRALGQWAVESMSLLLITSLFAATQAFHNTMSRYLFVLGREGFLWSGLATIHQTHGTPYVASSVQTAAMLLAVVVAAVCHLDPMMSVFPCMSAIGTMSILLLQGTVSVAVLMFFLRNPRLGVSVWSARIAPVLAAVCMFAALGKVIQNLDVMSGSSSPVIFLLPYLVFGIAVLGYLLAFVLNRFFPERYARLGHLVESLD